MEGEGGEVGCVRDGCSDDFSLVGGGCGLVLDRLSVSVYVCF